jgi:hypothetical protein
MRACCGAVGSSVAAVPSLGSACFDLSQCSTDSTFCLHGYAEHIKLVLTTLLCCGLLQMRTTGRSTSAAIAAAVAVVSAPQRATPHLQHMQHQQQQQHLHQHHKQHPLLRCPGCSPPRGMWSAQCAAYLCAQPS